MRKRRDIATPRYLYMTSHVIKIVRSISNGHVANVAIYVEINLGITFCQRRQCKSTRVAMTCAIRIKKHGTLKKENAIAQWNPGRRNGGYAGVTRVYGIVIRSAR